MQIQNPIIATAEAKSKRKLKKVPGFKLKSATKTTATLKWKKTKYIGRYSKPKGKAKYPDYYILDLSRQVYDDNGDPFYRPDIGPIKVSGKKTSYTVKGLKKHTKYAAHIIPYDNAGHELGKNTLTQFWTTRSK